MNNEQLINDAPQRRAAEMNENHKLKLENRLLREAAEHYFHCRTCAEDSVFSCPFGYKYGRLLDFISQDEKAG